MRVNRMLGSAILSAVVLAACSDIPTRLIEPGPSHLTRQTDHADCIHIDLHAVYSGAPATAPGIIDINHQFVFVDISNVEAYLPRSANPSTVRIGETWASGTPSESFQILDFDGDGNRDIRLRFLKAQLVTDGNLDLSTTEIWVWGLDTSVTPNDLYCGTFEVEVVQPPPPAGADVVVYNDLNIFDNTAMAFGATDNVTMVQNLVSFTSDGPRNDGTVVIWDRGRNSRCGPPPGNQECQNPNLATTRTTIEGEGFTFSDIMSGSGTLIDIPADVKSIWLWLPRVAYTNAEINALKQFAAEGGRVVFIGEWDGFYGPDGLAVQNDFLQKMGAVMVNTGGAVNCGYNTIPPGSIVHGHQVMDGVNTLRIACASVIQPGPQDFVLFRDIGNTQVLAGVARIDTSPLRGDEVFQQYIQKVRVRAGLNRRLSTGR